MTATFDRVEYLGGRDDRAAQGSSRRTLGEAIAAGPTCLRITYLRRIGSVHHHDVTAYGSNFRQLPRLDAIDRAALILYVLDRFPDIDWLKSHDFYPASDCVYASPDETERGWLPDEDSWFGGSDPVRLVGRRWFEPRPLTSSTTSTERAA